MLSNQSAPLPNQPTSLVSVVENFKNLAISFKNSETTHEGHTYLVLERGDNGEVVSSLIDRKEKSSSFIEITRHVEQLLNSQELNVEQKEIIFKGYRYIAEEFKSENKHLLSRVNVLSSEIFESLNPQEHLLIPFIHLLLTRENADPWPIEDDKLVPHFLIKDEKGETLSLSGFEKALLIKQSPFFKNMWTMGYKESDSTTQLVLNHSDSPLSTLEIFRILLDSLSNREILFEKEEAIFFLSEAAIQWQLNIEGINKSLNYLLHEAIYEENEEVIDQLIDFISSHYPLTVINDTGNFAVGYSWLAMDIDEETFSNRVLRLSIYPGSFSLNLEAASINGEKLSILSGLNVKELSLAVTNEELPYLAEMKELGILHLFSNSDINEGLVHLKKIEKLKSLSLHNSISNAGIEHVGGLRQLESLALISYNSSLSDADLQPLAQLEQLKKFRLSSRTITGEGFIYFEGMRKLEVLALENCNQIIDQSLSHLNKCLELEKLTIYYCEKISDEGLIHLKEYPQLQKLSIAACPNITKQGVSHLRKQLPLLEIQEF